MFVSKAIIKFFAGRESTLDSEVRPLDMVEQPLKRGLPLVGLLAVNGLDGQAYTLILTQPQALKGFQHPPRIYSFHDFGHP